MKTILKFIGNGAFLTCISLLLSSQVIAEDIELFVNNELAVKENARVMILFDTSNSMKRSAIDGKRCYNENNKYIECSEWNPIDPSDTERFQCRVGANANNLGELQDCPISRMQVAKNAINTLIDETTDVDIGLARFNDREGGFIVSGIGTGRQELKQQVNDFEPVDLTPLAETSLEIYYYFAGKQTFFSRNSTGRDVEVENGGEYISPFSNLANGEYQPRCDNNAFLMIVTDGQPYEDDQHDSTIINLLTDKDEDRPSAVQSSHLHSIARYMAKYDVYSGPENVDERVYTYTIGFGNGMQNRGKTILRTTASSENGNGKYYLAENASDLADTLKATVNEIREVSGTFSSPSVATSQSDNTRSQDSVYFAMFLPKTTSNWQGNIKKLKINGNALVDQNGYNATNEQGSIKNSAYTFWSTFDNTDTADGGSVEKGGLNQWFGGFDTRKVLTNVGESLQAFKDSESTVVENVREATNTDEEQAKTLINWSLGRSEIPDENGNWMTREDIMGDPLHSKPVVINYEINSKLVPHLLFGTNAGYIHFFADNGDNAASEKWSFIPQELYSIIPALKNKESGKRYGMDLSPTVHFNDDNGDGMVNGKDTVWAFFGMRRGGSSYYALDITNPNQPLWMWKRDNNSSGYKKLSQTWSQPKVVFVNINSHANKPLLVFGAGYNADKYEGEGTSNSGAGIYLVNAKSGNIVWKSVEGGGRKNTPFPGTDSITGSIASLDSDYDGYVDRFYASDLGGNIWRFDLPGNDPFGDTPWSVFKLASLGSAEQDSRKFFYQPEVTRTFYSKVTDISENNGVTNVMRASVPFEAIVIGSGNRTNPLGQNTSDKLFMLRDQNVVTKSYQSSSRPSTITMSNLMEMTEDTFGGQLNDYNKFVAQEKEMGAKNGWYYSLNSTEKALARPTVIGGVAYFPTFTPGTSTSVCSLTGGLGGLYAFHLHYGVKIYNNLRMEAGETIPPTPQIVFNENTDGKSRFLLIGAGAGDGNGVIQAKSINGNAVPVKRENEAIQLTSGFAGFKTHRKYTYRESSDRVNL
jgi:type IV pilus assembly protein PilY1